MTVGENIRILRKERGLTLKQLGDMIGVSEAYIRAYESGKRNPKIQSLQTLANALSVNVEALNNSTFDSITAMHRLFQVFRQYTGNLIEVNIGGEEEVAVSFGTLPAMRSWFERYQKYLEDVEACNQIKDVKARGEALIEAEASFDRWMDTYPEQETNTMMLEIMRAHDKNMDEIRKHGTE